MDESSPLRQNQTTRVLLKPNNFKYNRSKRATEEALCVFTLFSSHQIERQQLIG
jgi:hypothetical protein